MELILLVGVLLATAVIIVLLSYLDSKLDDSHTDWDTDPSEQIAPLLGVVQPNDKKDNK